MSVPFLSVNAQVDTIIWQQCYGTYERDVIEAIEKTPSGYMLGMNIDGNLPQATNFHGLSDAWIVNIDSLGNLIWERCYGGSKGSRCLKIININDSTYYLINDSESEDGDVLNNRPGTVWIVKIDLYGNIIWEYNYGGSVMGETAHDAVLMPDGGLIVIARFGFPAGGDITTYYGSNDMWVFCIDSNGELRWQKTFGNEWNDSLLKIKPASDSTYVMIGYHYASGGMIDCPYSGEWGDVWIVEIDRKGRIVNQWCFGGSQHDLGCDILKLEDSFVFVATTSSDDGDVSGFHGIGGLSPSDVWICSFDLSGNVLWQNCLGGFDTDGANNVYRTSDHGFLIFGSTFSNNGDVSYNHSSNGTSDIWVVKTDSMGQLQSEHCFGSSGDEYFFGQHSVTEVGEYDFVIGAQSWVMSMDVGCEISENSNWDGWIFNVKDCSFYSPDTPVVHSGPDTLCSTTDSTSLYSLSPVTGSSGYEWSLSPANAGTLYQNALSASITWNREYEGIATVSARCFNDCGYSPWSDRYFTSIFTCLGTNDNDTPDPSLSVYPNPARQTIIIEYELPEGTRSARLRILNITGTNLKTILLDGDVGKKVLDISLWNPGVYIYSLEGKETTSFGRIVIAK